MIDHQVLEWLNENELRCYPLSETGNKQFQTTLSLNRCILDASLFDFRTNESNTTVYLKSITVGHNDLITVAVTGQLDFTFLRTAATTYPIYSRNPEGSLLVFGAEMQQVTANVTFSGVAFEPSCVVQWPYELFGVQGFFMDTPGGAYLGGEVEFKEGFQFGLRATGQTIRMSAGRNNGRPISCESYFPSLADDCGSIISYINGVTTTTNPGILTLQAGPHVNIFDDPEHHRIYIGLDFTKEDVC